MENFVGQFYELVKSTPVEHTQKLNSFITDFDLENVLAENNNLDIDLSKLLGLNSTISNSDS